MPHVKRHVRRKALGFFIAFFMMTLVTMLLVFADSNGVVGGTHNWSWWRIWKLW